VNERDLVGTKSQTLKEKLLRTVANKIPDSQLSRMGLDRLVSSSKVPSQLPSGVNVRYSDAGGSLCGPNLKTEIDTFA
jgi:hypothetical protein